MGKLSEQDQAQLERLLAARDAPDEGDEVWIEDNGRTYKLRGQYAKAAHAHLFGDGDQGAAPPAAKPVKKAAAKKAAAKAPEGDEDPDDDDQGDEDDDDGEQDPPAARKHWLFGSPPEK